MGPQPVPDYGWHHRESVGLVIAGVHLDVDDTETPIFSGLVRDIEFADTYVGVVSAADVLDTNSMALPTITPPPEPAQAPSQRFTMAVLAALVVVLAVLLGLAVAL